MLGVRCDMSQAQALERGMFGWRAEEAVGTRPLLVIWLHEPDGTASAEASPSGGGVIPGGREVSGPYGRGSLSGP